jgi:amino acid transporter
MEYPFLPSQSIDSFASEQRDFRPRPLRKSTYSDEAAAETTFGDSSAKGQSQKLTGTAPSVHSHAPTPAPSFAADASGSSQPRFLQSVIVEGIEKPLSSNSYHSYGSVSTEASDIGGTEMSPIVIPMSVEQGVVAVEEEETSRPNSPFGFSDSSMPDESNASSADRGKLSLAGLAVMVFYSVSGGPFGVEASVRSAGNFYTLLGFVVFPFIWSVQEAMMTAELGAAFPEASGGVAWVEEAFGSKWGFMSGFLGWVAGATDNAIYPVLFLDYLLQVISTDGDSMDPVTRFVLLAGTSIALAYVNWLGLPVVGNMSIVICAVAMSPFLVLTVVGAFSVDTSRWFQGPILNQTAIETVMDDDGGIIPVTVVGGILLRPFLNNLFWNLNSFDAGASFAEDIDDPGRVLPKAMGYSIVMVVLGYLLPLLVALGASGSIQTDWVDGYLARVCSEIVGPWLGAWTVFAAGISNIALFQAELSADAFQLMGMAERGHLPKVFATRSRHGTPTFGILLGCAVIVLMGAANVDRLIEMLNFNYAISLLLEYAAFVQLRLKRPDLHRPFRIPLNTTCCVLALVPTFVFTFAVLALADYGTYIFAVLVNAAGLCLYYCMRRIRERTDFTPSSPIGFGLFSNAASSKAYERVETDLSTVQTDYTDNTRASEVMHELS